MEFEQVVRKRRIVRHFTPQPVSRESLERILDLARHSPSAGFTQGQSFVVVTDPDTRQAIAELCGEKYYVGKLEFEVLHCPGHTPGHVVLYERNEQAVFVGDVLFAGSVGRTDLPGGSTEELLSSIRNKLLTLGDDVKVYSGHGPVTTIGEERLTNPFLVHRFI